jgi:hypothetical protein
MCGAQAHVRFGSQADICAAKSDVRFTPNSDRESRHVPMVMSALPSKADLCSAMAHVCYGPIADMPTLFNYLIGALLEVHRNFKAERLGRLQIDDQFILRRVLHR